MVFWLSITFCSLSLFPYGNQFDNFLANIKKDGYLNGCKRSFVSKMAICWNHRFCVIKSVQSVNNVLFVWIWIQSEHYKIKLKSKLYNDRQISTTQNMFVCLDVCVRGAWMVRIFVCMHGWLSGLRMSSIAKIYIKRLKSTTDIKVCPSSFHHRRHSALCHRCMLVQWIIFDTKFYVSKPYVRGHIHEPRAQRMLQNAHSILCDTTKPTIGDPTCTNTYIRTRKEKTVLIFLMDIDLFLLPSLLTLSFIHSVSHPPSVVSRRDGKRKNFEHGAKQHLLLQTIYPTFSFVSLPSSPTRIHAVGTSIYTKAFRWQNPFWFHVLSWFGIQRVVERGSARKEEKGKIKWNFSQCMWAKTHHRIHAEWKFCVYTILGSLKCQAIENR